jgi:septal ring factor EnvC (AmiA/AmiB activator)
MATKELEELLDRVRDLTATTARMVDLSVDAREELRALAGRVSALEGPVSRLVSLLEAKDKALAALEAEKQAGRAGVWTLLANPAITAAIAAIVAAVLSWFGFSGGADAH